MSKSAHNHPFPRCLKPLLALVFLGAAVLRADVTPASLFTDNAVLQSGMAVPVWGTATPGERVEVSYAGQRQQTQADAQGNWMLALDALKPKLSGQLVIKGERNTVTFSNVVTGEVWLVSGQSNATMPLRNDLDGKKEAAGANFPDIREFRTAIFAADEPQTTVPGTWKVCTPQTAGEFSAMGYFFARNIHEALDVPVGIINSNKGGAPIHSMTAREVFEKSPHAQTVVDYMQAAGQRWEKRFQDKQARQKANNEPGESASSDNPYFPGPKGYCRTAVLFNSLINPLIPYAIRGTLWNQGEADVPLTLTSVSYKDLLADLIADWRARWQRPDLPFYIVQLANISDKMSYETSGRGWPLMREAQAQIQELPNAHTAVCIDIGELNDRHPRNKRELGRRLALLAQKHTYQKPIAADSPFFKSAQIKNGKIICQFTEAARGLKTSDGQAPGAFEIAGEDGQFIPAQAKIEGQTIVVWADAIKNPKIARYAWSNPATNANIVNAANLPLSPFRTGTR